MATAEGSYRYHCLRIALAEWGKNLSQLNVAERQQVEHKARRSFDLESRVLATPEAAAVTVEPAVVEQACGAIADRYSDRTAFLLDLQQNHLTEAALRTALYRELKFDALLQQIGSRAAAITEHDILLYYQLHLEQFQQPEQRTVSHILITINPDFAENSRERAQQRIEAAAAQLRGRTSQFSEVARRISECPTALEGGRLGVVPAGQLFPELDRTLFQLAAGEMSGVVESELGFHLLLCEAIQPAYQLPLEQVHRSIRTRLEQRQQHQCQKAWIQSCPLP